MKVSNHTWSTTKPGESNNKLDVGIRPKRLCNSRIADFLSKATCWCGRLQDGASPFGDVQLSSTIFNGCTNTCNRVGECPNDTRTNPCEKLCHPGPCDWPCMVSCYQQPDAIICAQLSAWGRFRRRWSRRDNIFRYWMFVVGILYCATVVLLPFRIG